MDNVLGVDIGRVITNENMIWAFTSLKRLNNAQFKDRIYLVSRCDATRDDHTLKWFKTRGFHEFTGIPTDNIHFCQKYEEKARISADLGITHFIDDRLEVLKYLADAGINNLYLFNPREEEMAPFKEYLPKVRRVKNWQEIDTILL